jgi:diacylglycerol kinase
MISHKKFIFSLRNAFSGLRYLYSSQNNIRIHFFATICAIILGIILKISILDWCLVLLTIGIVWIIEAINTVFERLFDLMDQNINPIVKIGKDVSAAAVLISAIVSLIIGFIIFSPSIIRFFQK